MGSLDRNFRPDELPTSIENHGFDSGKILYEYADELDTKVTIDVTFWIAGDHRAVFLEEFKALTDDYRI